ncbi:MAG: M56 family metallopeptidase [Streptomycetales bacterium]
MSAPLVLFGYTLLLGTLAAAVLRRAEWPDRAPWLGIAVWQAVSVSAVLAVVLGGAALVVPAVAFTTDVAALIDACQMALRAQYATPGGVLVSGLGAGLAVGVGARGSCCLAAALVAAGRQRRRQRDMLALIARRDDALDAVVVDHDVPVVYCLPGRGRQIVLTSAALASLDAEQLQAVLAHERAHLRGRHHLVLAAAAGLERAFAGVPLFRHAREQIARLVEMLADDAAAHRCERHAVAAALVTLAEGSAPAAALAAGGPSALARVRRLLAPARPLGRARLVIGVVALAALLSLPVLVAAAPALEPLRMSFCPIDGVGASGMPPTT